MLRHFIVQLFIMVAAWGFSVNAYAQTDASAGDVLETISEKALDAVQRHKDSYKATPDTLETELLTILDGSLDFQSFSKGVMGRYYASATPEQRSAFTGEFKATLVELYTSALVAAKIDNIDIVETVSKKPGRANVVMEARSQGGDSYLLQYNMRQNAEGKWRIRNIILDGVNIGLTYRNQFKSAMASEGEDLAKVITLWPEIVEGE